MSTLGKQIRESRKKHGWSQETLAGMVRVHRTTVQNWELGNTKPKALHLWMLRKILGCSLTNEGVKNAENKTREKAPTTG